MHLFTPTSRALVMNIDDPTVKNIFHISGNVSSFASFRARALLPIVVLSELRPVRARRSQLYEDLAET